MICPPAEGSANMSPMLEAHRVKLADVTVAAVCGVVPLSSEVAAWIVLQATERLREIGGGVPTAEAVAIDTDGEVTIVETLERSEDTPASRALRGMLDDLLRLCPSSTSRLRLCACRPDPTPLDLLARELEGALTSPIDRAAMRDGVKEIARATFVASAEDEVGDTFDAIPEVDWTKLALAAAAPRAASTTATVIAPAASEDVEKAAIESRRVEEVELDRDRRLKETHADFQRRLREVEADRDRRVKELEGDRDRRVRELEASRDRRIRELEADRDRRLLAVEKEVDELVDRHKLALEEAWAERAKALEEAEARRSRLLQETKARFEQLVVSARERAVAEAKATHETAIATLDQERVLEKKELRDKIDELEYALARAGAERDAERSLRVDAEVATANKMREMRRPVGASRPSSEGRVATYRDLDEPADSSSRKWWK